MASMEAMILQKLADKLGVLSVDTAAPYAVPYLQGVCKPDQVLQTRLQDIDTAASYVAPYLRGVRQDQMLQAQLRDIKIGPHRQEFFKKRYQVGIEKAKEYGLCKVCCAVTTNRCASCKGTFFCSKPCLKIGWNGGPALAAHKFVCGVYKYHMKEELKWCNIILQFTWGKEALAGLALEYLHTKDYNNGIYWHDDYGMGGELVSYGSYLLKPAHVKDHIGWKGLPADMIPWRLNNTYPGPPIECIKPGQLIHSWVEWYQWRGLPLSSPVALVMDRAMTLYYSIAHVLGFKPRAPPKPSQDNTIPQVQFRNEVLKFHLLGATGELDCLPTFSELALLLPGYDIHITLFGPAVADLMKLAKARHPTSLAGRSIPPRLSSGYPPDSSEGPPPVPLSTSSKPGNGKPVYKYTAPPSHGGSTVKIYLDGCHPYWGSSDTHGDVKTTALLAQNAGIGIYDTWSEPIAFSLCNNVPFIITDFNMHCIEIDAMAVTYDLLTRMLVSVSRLAKKKSLERYVQICRNKKWFDMTRTRIGRQYELFVYKKDPAMIPPPQHLIPPTPLPHPFVYKRMTDYGGRGNWRWGMNPFLKPTEVGGKLTSMAYPCSNNAFWLDLRLD